MRQKLTEKNMYTHRAGAHTYGTSGGAGCSLFTAATTGPVDMLISVWDFPPNKAHDGHR